MIRYILILMLSLCMAQSKSFLLAGAENDILSDPGFEQNGTLTSQAHSGKRAGVLKINAPSRRWNPIKLKAPLKVEPFATYRISGWVKGSHKGGRLLALYAHGVNSYGWEFIHYKHVKSNEWQKVSIEICVPDSIIQLYPLVAEKCSQVEAYIDDLKIEKILTPQQTIAKLNKNSKSPQAEMLLARWSLAQGDSQTVIRKYLRGRNRLVASDAACLLAQNSPPEKKVRYVSAMIKTNCFTYANGHKRLEELIKTMPLLARVKVALDSLDRRNGASYAKRAVKMLLTQEELNGNDLSISEAQANLEEIDKLVKPYLKRKREKAISTVLDMLEKAKDAIKTRATKQSRAKIFFKKKRLSPENYQIVIADSASPSEQQAAKELQRFLQSITGQRFEINQDSKADSRNKIIIGKSSFAKNAVPATTLKKLGSDGIRMLTDGNNLILSGNQRGVLYAVYEFLKNYCNVRWIADDCTVIPEKGELVIPSDLDITYVPALKYRTTSYINVTAPRFAVPHKLNGVNLNRRRHKVSPRWGGKIRYQGFVHTFRALFPVKKYFAKHPEYFSMVKGKRVSHHPQLCLTNPEVLQLTIEKIKKWVQTNPDCKIFSVSQNDWANYCECPSCSALAKKEGSQSGPIIHFVNAVADEIAKTHPDVLIDTLAYKYSRKAPKYVKPRSNVVIRLCTIECCFSHPLDKCPQNKSFVEDIRSWSKICKHLHIWDYIINFHHEIMPFPNLRTLQPNIKFFINNGVDGLFEQANAFSTGGEFAKLRSYLVLELMWNPESDVKKLTKEFLKHYYGKAAPYIGKYIELLHSSISTQKDVHVTIYSPPEDYLNNDKLLDEATKFFKQAEEAVKDDKIKLARVQEALLPILYTKIALGKYHLQIKNGYLKPNTSTGRKDVDKFMQIAGKLKIKYIGEGRPFSAWANQINIISNPLKIIELKNSKLTLHILPELGGRIWQIFPKNTQKDILWHSGSQKKGWEPVNDGYEEYSTSKWRSAGWADSFRVVRKSKKSIDLEADLPNNFTMKRRIELSEQEAGFKVISQLINRSTNSRNAQFRIHPAFALSNFSGAFLEWQDQKGKTHRKNLVSAKNSKNDFELYLSGTNMPDKKWLFFNPANNITVENYFNPKQIASCYANWNGTQKRINLEQWSKARKLKPNAKIVVENYYKVITK